MSYFIAYWRVKLGTCNKTAKSAPGVGLGLALNRRLARTMGGDLRLEQTKAAGTIFNLSLKSTGTRV